MLIVSCEARLLPRLFVHSPRDSFAVSKTWGDLETLTEARHPEVSSELALYPVIPLSIDKRNRSRP
jgi:hypothetical protein